MNSLSDSLELNLVSGNIFFPPRNHQAYGYNGACGYNGLETPTLSSERASEETFDKFGK